MAGYGPARPASCQMGDKARADDAVQSPSSADTGHADGALLNLLKILDLLKIEEIGADEWAGDARDIGDRRRLLGARISVRIATAARTRPGSRMPTGRAAVDALGGEYMAPDQFDQRRQARGAGADKSDSGATAGVEHRVDRAGAGGAVDCRRIRPLRQDVGQAVVMTRDECGPDSVQRSSGEADPVDNRHAEILQAIVWRVGMRRHGHPGESMCPHRYVNLRPDLLPIIAVGRNKAAKRE